jgi:hypothetical protein
MFQSLNRENYLSEEAGDPNYWIFQYTLVDDQFGEVNGIAPDFPSPDATNMDMNVPSPSPIIIEYRKRGLNVEGNLVIWCLQQCNIYDCSTKDLLKLFDVASGIDGNERFAELWKTVDQAKVLRLATFG